MSSTRAINKKQYDEALAAKLASFKDELHILNQQLKTYQEKVCQHKETRFVPDASGNKDSYTVCLECGMEV